VQPKPQTRLTWPTAFSFRSPTASFPFRQSAGPTYITVIADELASGTWTRPTANPSGWSLENPPERGLSRALADDPVSAILASSPTSPPPRTPRRGGGGGGGVVFQAPLYGPGGDPLILRGSRCEPSLLKSIPVATSASSIVRWRSDRTPRDAEYPREFRTAFEGLRPLVGGREFGGHPGRVAAGRSAVFGTWRLSTVNPVSPPSRRPPAYDGESDPSAWRGGGGSDGGGNRGLSSQQSACWGGRTGVGNKAISQAGGGGFRCTSERCPGLGTTMLVPSVAGNLRHDRHGLTTASDNQMTSPDCPGLSRWRTALPQFSSCWRSASGWIGF